MGPLNTLKHWLRALLKRDALETELDDELVTAGLGSACS